MGCVAGLLLPNGRPPGRKANDFQKKEDERKAELERAEKGASGPAASSARESESSETKTKRVLLLPSFPVAPISEQEQELVAARRVEREEVEKRLAERAANLTKLFKHFTTEPTQLKERLGRRWEQRDNQSVCAKTGTQSGGKEYFLTPDEAWQTSDDLSLIHI